MGTEYRYAKMIIIKGCFCSFTRRFPILFIWIGPTLTRRVVFARPVERVEQFVSKP